MACVCLIKLKRTPVTLSLPRLSLTHSTEILLKRQNQHYINVLVDCPEKGHIKDASGCNARTNRPIPFQTHFPNPFWGYTNSTSQLMLKYTKHFSPYSPLLSSTNHHRGEQASVSSAFSSLTILENVVHCLSCILEQDSLGNTF